MIPYRPIAPLTAGPKKGWKAVVAAVLVAALLGTTAPAAIAAEPPSAAGPAYGVADSGEAR
ncbi:hypothetical protein Achl_0308 [Pseudarthrobacter chlorophenolicus A6]|uniref:Uncharacterized protein n=1 Tax=Pseudarthrobacter chlorophenolicus (strain ATCC 700700 / DSM 12829 / CIP 107037 / JCM 12360 / KCTC 9906 / NCIMB 13794 / A6) TaxID=452863 RepID=B8H9S4_PSECP|nr:hypothetical protein [Pseudarthrobacter chlorophenolicus]ACL38308.1 hypothetical protein Achl_0308 [Pseudarthrobacter chlorophenolicus A6]SDQ51280.1 hypothetical protein SAMN04489738_1224 [Pseudarthrobacter chlorophenolicus]